MQAIYPNKEVDRDLKGEKEVNHQTLMRAGNSIQYVVFNCS